MITKQHLQANVERLTKKVFFKGPMKYVFSLSAIKYAYWNIYLSFVICSPSRLYHKNIKF